MKLKMLIMTAVLALASLASASTPMTTQERVSFRATFRSGYFGPPVYAADPIACNATTKGLEYYNSATLALKWCNGTAWKVSPIASYALTFAGPTAARTYTLPDATETIATLGQANAFTGANSHSGVETFNNSIQGTMTAKTLTESSATTFATLTVATGSRIAGTVAYSVEANDASDFQVRGGIIPFTAVNKAGTITCTVGTVTTATEVVSVSAGTLANTMTCADATSGVLNLLANAVSSLTQTTLQIRYRIATIGTSTITAQ